MKFLIISDIHDNLVNLEKCLNWGRNQGIENAVCAGDVVNSDTLAYLAKNFKTIYLVRGNLEIYDEAEVGQYKNIKYLGRFGVFEIDGKTVGLYHEPWFIKKVAAHCHAPLKKCDIIFYGHTHRPWLEEKNGVMMANPGTLGGVFFKATFAVWDSVGAAGQPPLELKIFGLF